MGKFESRRAWKVTKATLKAGKAFMWKLKGRRSTYDRGNSRLFLAPYGRFSVGSTTIGLPNSNLTFA